MLNYEDFSGYPLDDCNPDYNNDFTAFLVPTPIKDRDIIYYSKYIGTEIYLFFIRKTDYTLIKMLRLEDFEEFSIEAVYDPKKGELILYDAYTILRIDLDLFKPVG